MNCAQCHYAGEGNDLMPALIGSAALAEPPERTIQIILHGQRGVSEVDGRKIGGIMPPQEYLSDEEIAAIVTYVRTEFAGQDDAVTPEDVAKLR